jgi:hypothetical protein
VATLAEDLVLLMTDPDSGRIVVDTTALDRAVAGALLLDLALRERLDAEGTGRRVRLFVSNAGRSGEPVLDVALDLLGDSRLPAVRAVERLTKRTRDAVFDRLEQRNLVRRFHARILGVFPSIRWQVLDAAAQHHLRARVAGVLLDGQPPDIRVACLISLLHAVRAAHRVVDGPARLIRARAAEIAGGERIGSAVRSAVDGVRNVVVMAAFSAATGVSGQQQVT